LQLRVKEFGSSKEFMAAAESIFFCAKNPSKAFEQFPTNHDRFSHESNHADVT
jgi:hypothetical protein